MEALRLYWAACFPTRSFERRSASWTDVGFQSDDPGRDFRGAGIFGLRCLLYFATKHPSTFQRCVKSGYPLSIAGLNVSMLLYQLLGWGFKVGGRAEQLPLLSRLILDSAEARPVA